MQLPPHPDAGFVPQILVDKVRYSTSAPWPNGSASGTNSLQRISAVNYGNDPVNWQSAPPTPGRLNGSNSNPDTDGDGMTDAWELDNFGTLARDGSRDFDGDAVSDLKEFLAGTDPKDAGSYLHLTLNAYDTTSCTIGFRAVAGKSYSVVYRDNFDGGSWLKLADIPVRTASGTVSVTDTNVSSSVIRFYRIVTPSLP
ncbi:MAG: hypothetical protein IPK15_01225 [Verrucomicrobia bacterium]|nr:hypothetical protein [Verrucomicrobiota bacterium]